MKQVKNPATIRKILGLVVIVLIVIGIITLLVGESYERLEKHPAHWLYVLINLAPELAGISVGVFTIDYLNNWRQDLELKRQLIRQLGSPHPEVAVTATNELGANGRNPEKGDSWLTDGSLAEADLIGADLSKAKLVEADLRAADLREANLTDAKLTGANLTGADLAGAILIDAYLADANLSGADLREADLTGAVLVEANLNGAILFKSDLTGANLTDANLWRANLWRANLTGANLTGADLAGAILNEETTMPDGKLFKGWDEYESRTKKPDEE